MNEHRAQPDLLSPQAVLSRTTHDLAAKYVGVFSPQTVERYVFESYTALRRTAKIHTHLTSLAARFAADRLTAGDCAAGLSQGGAHMDSAAGLISWIGEDPA